MPIYPPIASASSQGYHVPERPIMPLYFPNPIPIRNPEKTHVNAYPARYGEPWKAHWPPGGGPPDTAVTAGAVLSVHSNSAPGSAFISLAASTHPPHEKPTLPTHRTLSFGRLLLDPLQNTMLLPPRNQHMSLHDFYHLRRGR